MDLENEPFCYKGKKPKNWSYLGGYFTFILGTKVQSNKAHSMTQVPMKGQGQRSRSNFPPKLVKKQRTGHISEAISPTDFILGTKVQPNKAHSMTQVPMTLTFSKVKIKFSPKLVKY